MKRNYHGWVPFEDGIVTISANQYVIKKYLCDTIGGIEYNTDTMHIAVDPNDYDRLRVVLDPSIVEDSYISENEILIKSTVRDMIKRFVHGDEKLVRAKLPGTEDHEYRIVLDVYEILRSLFGVLGKDFVVRGIRSNRSSCGSDFVITVSMTKEKLKEFDEKVFG